MMPRLSALLMAALVFPQLAVADAPAAATPKPAESTDRFDRIWQLSRLTASGEYPSIKLRGRYHGQQYWVDAGDDGRADDWEHRRFRLGMDIGFSDRFEFSFDLNLDRNGVGPLVDDFDYAAFQWQVDDATRLQFGKLRRMPLTREDGTSSNNILTIERSLIAARFLLDNTGGVYVEHERGRWTVGGGVLSGSLDEDNLGLPTLDGGIALQGNVAYQATPATELRLDYVYNEGNPDNNAIAPFRHMVSLNSASQWQRFGLITDIIFADALPAARGDLFSVVLMPHYKLTPRLQAVARFTYAGSNAVDGVRLSSRYERRANQLAGDRGDDYQAWYAGLNYYFYGHRLKLMAGIEHTRMQRPVGDYEALTAAASMRIYF
ncbi:MAG: porin [Steroidobacteraceae bacterium]